MKINRKITNIIRAFFDDWIPPVIRDSRWFMEIPLRVVFTKKSDFYINFKKEILKMSEKEYITAYEQFDSLIKARETDLSRGSVKLILSNISGKTVLDAGCGKGYLVVKLSKDFTVTAMDLVESKFLAENYPKINWVKGNIERMPFENEAFDTVICTHTLEHVVNIFEAISELRRVTKRRLIVVVPKQRPYFYTFDMHFHFFPYTYSLQMLMGIRKNSYCVEIDGDLFYMEDK